MSAPTRHQVLTAAAANTTGTVYQREPDAVIGRLSWSKTGAGTATIRLYDALSGALILEQAIVAGTTSGALTCYLPNSWRVDLASVASTVAVTAWVEQ